MVVFSPILSIGMQGFQALGSPKKGRPAFEDITNVAAAARHVVSSEEQVSAQFKIAYVFHVANAVGHAIESARDAQHQRESSSEIVDYTTVHALRFSAFLS